MGFMDGLADLFPHTVQIAPWTGQNTAGEGTYGTAETYRAKVERGVFLVRPGLDGRALVPQYKVFIAEAVQVDLRDQVTLDKAFGQRDEHGDFTDGPTVALINMEPKYDEQEWVATILYCG
jgi:hypothetical protein